MRGNKGKDFIPLEYDPKLHKHLPESRKKLFRDGKVWHSKDHIVIQRLSYCPGLTSEQSPVWHLSVKRKDNGKMDWAEKQKIKNSFCGEQHEGFEIFPPESEKIDTSNQYHLWVFKDPSQRLGVQLYQ